MTVEILAEFKWGGGDLTLSRNLIFTKLKL